MGPLQVPEEYLDKFPFVKNDEEHCHVQTQYVNPSNSSFSCRKQYRAMVNLLDDQIGKLVAKLRVKAFGMICY